MNEPTLPHSTHSHTARTQVSVVIVCVVALCLYALFFKAVEENNWPGFWFSVAHVTIVAIGAWLALRKGR